MKQRRTRPYLFWFGLAVVALPAILSSFSLLLLNRLWLSSGDLSKYEMDAAAAAWQVEQFVGDFIGYKGKVVEASGAAPRAEVEATLTLEAKQRLPAIKAAYRAYWRDKIREARKPFPKTGPEFCRHICDMLGSPRGPDRVKEEYYVRLLDSESRSTRAIELMGAVVNDDCRALMRLKGGPNLRTVLDKIQAITKIRIAEGVPTTISPRPQATLLPDSIALFRGVSSLVDAFQEFAAQQNAQIEVFRQEVRQLQPVMTACAYGGFAASVLVAIALILAYSRYISSRLANLVDDAAAIARRTGKLLPISGNDEIAYVQDILVKADNRLRVMEKYRAFMLDMVAHDVRTPLMSAQLSIGLAKPALEKKWAPQIAAIQIDLQGTLAFVGELLAVERLSEEADSAALTSEPTRLPLTSLRRSGMFKKVLVLAGLPLLLQFGWLCWFTDRLHLQQDLSIRNEEWAQAIFLTNSTVALVGDTVVNRMLSSITHNRKCHDRQIADEVALKSIKAKIGVLAFETHPAQDFAGDLQVFIERATEAFARPIEVTVLTGGWVRDEADMAMNILMKWSPTIVKEWESSILLQNEYSAFAAAMQNLIAIGLISNLILFSVLLLFFMRNIKRRLNLVIRSAATLGDPNASNIQVGGADELGLLGDALNSCRDQLKQMTARRASIMSQVGNDMCAPLVVADGKLVELEDSIKGAGEDEALADLQRARKSIGQVVALINQLLTVEMLEASKFALDRSECSIDEVVQESVELVKPLALKKSVEIQVGSASGSLKMDRSRVVQVLVNLISNAVKFSPPNATVSVDCQTDERQVRITVIDRGPGMDANTTSMIFNRFFQAETVHSREGFGLGLFISKLLVELHGGDIRVDSELNQGSSFTVTLPKQVS